MYPVDCVRHIDHIAADEKNREMNLCTANHREYVHRAELAIAIRDEVACITLLSTIMHYDAVPNRGHEQQ